MTPTHRAASWIRVNLVAVALGLAAAAIGWVLQGGSALFAQNWTQIGVALAVARITNLRAWLGIWIVLSWGFDWYVLEATRWPGWLLRGVFGATMAGQVLLGAHFLRDPTIPANPIESRRGVLRLFLLSGIVAGILGSLVRIGINTLFTINLPDLGYLVVYRFSNHVEGAMVMAPLIFMAWYHPWPKFRPSQYLEGAAILVLLLLLTHAASTGMPFDLGSLRGILILLILPLTLWSTLRLGAHGAVLSIFTASLFPIWGTLRGMSPFGAPPGTSSELLLEVFLIVTSTTTLIVAAVLAEKNVATEELLEAKANLEQRVRSRTEEVRSERDFTSAVLDAVGALILVMKDDGTILRFNRACEELTGKRFEEVRGRSVWEIGVIPAAELEEVRARVTIHAPTTTGENHWIAKDGSQRLFRWTNTLLPETPEVIIGVGLDVTEARQAQQEADDAILARDEFLSVASHELKTPLTTLLLQLQSLQRLAKKEQQMPVELAYRLEIGLRQSRRLARLVDELLDVSRIMHGKIAVETIEMDLAEALREAIDRHAADAAEAGSTITVHGADQPLEGRWDLMRIEQVLANLLSNAIKYGGGRPIEVALRQVGRKVEISVTDHGIGISEEDQRRVFDRFERAVSLRHYGGFGLGLWITRQIVEAHGGTISVHSTLGEGSTFTVCLPLEPPV